jgi:Protein of unknown function (DUF3147)
MLEYGLRFLAGGIAVSAFAALGDTLRPKSFAGLFGAAPSIALATLLITLSHKSAPFAAVEGRSMIVGAFALAGYSWVVCVLLKNSCCPHGPLRRHLWLSGSSLRLVYPRRVVGGLFLAFPAIFPASATLIEKHVRQRKEKAGLPGARRGKEAAALDAAGAALGSLGLAAFGLMIWLMIGQSPAWALVLAAASWLTVSMLAWQVRRWL